MVAAVPWNEVAAFVAVVAEGSLTAAARSLRVPKSTVSRAVRRLEDALEVELLERSNRSIRPTRAGAAYYKEVAPHVGGIVDATRGLTTEEDEVAGTLRVTVPPDTADVFTGGLVARFAARHPRLQVEVEASGRIIDLVKEGFDVALRATSKLDASSALVARKVVASRVGLFAAPAYLAQRGAPRAVEDLPQHDGVGFRTVTGDWPIEAAGAARGRGPRARITTNDFGTLRALIRSGAGIGLLPLFLGQEDVLRGSLVRVLPSWSRPAGALYVVYPKARHVPAKVTAFRAFVMEEAKRVDFGEGTRGG